MQSSPRRRLALYGLAAALLFPAWTLAASEVASPPPELQLSLTQAPAAMPAATSYRQPKSTLSLAPEGAITPPRTAADAPRSATRRSARTATPASLAGKKVMTVRTLRSDSFGDDGNSCTVSAVGSDSILIRGFWNNAVSLKAKVEGDSIFIPNQVVGQMVDNGDIDIAYCLSNGKPDRKRVIKGVINADGSIYIPDWWGIYVVAGTNKDRYPYAGYDTRILPANATMSFNFADGTHVDHSVHVTQPYDNRVYITNFGDYGMTVYVDLDPQRGGAIPTQCARQYPANKANFMTCAIGSYADGQPQDITPTIHLKNAPAGVGNVLEWGNWSAISQGTQLMFFGAITDGKITYDGTFTYPEAVTGQLRGTGTEADPYLVSSLKDMQVLARMVNSVPESEYNAFLNGVSCARVLEGKHIRLTQDIDMGSTLFTPVGADAYHYFAGTFDGQGHTIKNLSIYSNTGLAGLFGLVDAKGVVKNLRLDSPKVTSNFQTAGTVAGWSFGTTDNCHVTGADVTNYARIAGGLVGVGHVVTNCTVKDSRILGANGNPGGIAGSVDSLITDCHVERTLVTGATGQAGLPAGGVVGALTDGHGADLSFTGTVDTRTYMCTMSTGGVVGVLSNSTLERSFANGEVMAGPTDNYSRPSAAGGVVGKAYGSVIENCFFTGKASTYTNRMAGGITGWLVNDVRGTDTIAPVVRNSYTASVISSETYLYDKENEARETIGWIDAACSPTLTNLYYDNQLTNLNSTRFGTTTAALTSGTPLQGLDAAVWQYQAGQYPRLKATASTPNALAAASAIILPERSSLKKVSADAQLHPLGDVTYTLIDGGKFSTIQGNVLKISDDFGTDTIVVANGAVSYELELRIAPVPFEGEGTAENPFLLRTRADILTLAHVTTEVLQTFPGDHFLLANDIDMENDSTFIGICAQPGTAGTFNKFAGIFDGGGHSIKNLHMRMIPWATAPWESADGQGTPDSKNANGVMGFFGRLAPEGIIRNLVIDPSCDFYFWSRSGAIVGQNEGLVENCRNHADVWAASAVPGGIVGENRKGTVRRCYNSGTVTTGSTGAGGIVGTGNGRVEECVNVGPVRAMLWTKFVTNAKSVYRVGGIQGENQGTDFYDCVNLGPVSGYKEVGGIAGQLANVTSTTVLGHNELHRVISLGDISSQEEATVGALGGTNGTHGAIEHAHWDAQIIPHKAHGALTLQGTEGLTTARLTSGTPLQGFSADVWDFAKGQYPVPAWCKDEPLLRHARSLVVTMDPAYTSANFHGTATLAGLAGHAWTLDDGSPYTIAGNTLSAPATVTEPVAGTLRGTSGGYDRVISLVTNIPVPLQGAGTEADPYRITNADEWLALAAYIPAAKDGFAGRFIKLANDIDFADKQFKPLFIGTMLLEGTLDGDGHTVKNIAYTAVNSYEAAVGAIDGTGLLRNFRAQGQISTAVANTGAITSKVYGRIENCENLVDLTATKGAGHSGFGYFYHGARADKVVNRATITGANGQLAGISHNVSDMGCTFTDCANYGTIKSTSTATSCNNFGGLVATCNPATFVRCFNDGKFIFGKPDCSNQVGGIVGNATATTATSVQPMVMTGCYNLSDIVAGNILGGLVANLANACALELTDCYNRGKISSETTKSGTSGLAGITAYYSAGSTLRNCVNYGLVHSDKNVFPAGITGTYKGTPTEAKPVLLTNCHNYGDIEALGNQGVGIMGCAAAWVTIDSCSNRGDITGGWGLAGICGNYSAANTRITRCWNSGDITTSSYRAGGITAWGNMQGEISDCYNLGDIATTSTIKGTAATSGSSIGGISGYTGAIITRCYNLGTVTGASRVGGITGEVFKGRTQLIGCYNAGEIVADPDTCGSLIGLNTASGASWNADNLVKDCHYIAQAVQPDHDAAFPGLLTQRQLCAIDLGQGWTKGDDFTYPTLAANASDEALLAAACIIFDGNDTPAHVTYNFSVGCPEGVAWSSDRSEVRFDGTRVRFNKAYIGPMTLTARLGDLARTFSLNVDNPTGVDEVDGAEILTEQYYTLDGVRIPAPTAAGIYVVTRTYTDGTRRTSKVQVR